MSNHNVENTKEFQSKSNSLTHERKRTIPAVQPISERRQRMGNRVSKSLGWMVSLAFHLLIMLFVAFHIAKNVAIHDDDAVVTEMFQAEKIKPIRRLPEREAKTIKPEIRQTETIQPSQPVKPVDIPSGPGEITIPSDNLDIDSPDAPPEIPRIERPPIAEGERPSIEPELPKIAPTKPGRPSIFNEIETDIPDADIGLDDTVNVPVVDITENTIPPKALHKPKPKYPERARNAGKEGVVKLKATIGIDGKASDIEVLEPLGYGCDEEAIEALKRSRFSPAQKDGKPVAIRIIIPYRFKIED